ncbi:MAG: efflux RND transporter periplasmic adaptor subunit [Clostridium saudiense]|uniref:efflux RND transporter periplasmic adaptor subunit n=1 Tax=Clostridium saudiense TaxID=1414720 RepID=UPI00399507C3
MSKNEKIKKIINFKYIKKGKDTLQKKAVKALFAFLVLMIGCTMLSRAADSMTIPRIKVDTPKSKTIVDEVKAKGVVAKNREEKISVVEGLKINYVNISVGSSIKVGDTLVELDKDDLQAKVDEIKKNIEQEQKTLSRATEDYNKAINTKKKAVQTALNEMNTAKQALDNYNNLSEEEKDSMMEESLKADYESKKELYNSAVADSNDTVDLDRSLQDTKDSLKIEEYNKELAKLQPLLDASGKIVSEKEGIVTSVVAENGGVTTDTIASIADKNEGYKFVGEIDKSNRTLVKQGQTVALNLGSSGIIENLTIDSISKNDDNPDTLKVTVVLPVGIGEIDESGEIIVSSKSKKYGTCVPLAALRQGDGDSYYILVVTEKETVLGEELTAKKVDVKVEKRDGEYAAVSDGSLGRNDKIIIDSNKTVEDGDRVRLEIE